MFSTIFTNMIFDCFLYHREEDMLKIRCEEMKGLDVTHVLIEAPLTHSGKPKPLYYNRDQFLEYNIINFSIEDLPKPDYFAIEKHSRNAIKAALNLLGAENSDVVILGDVDELVTYSVLDNFITSGWEFAAVKMAFSRFFINTIKPKEMWDRCRLFRGSYIKDKDMETIRNSGYENVIYGGVHGSYSGGVNAIIEKLQSFSHVEFSDPSFLNREKWELLIEGLIDPFDKTELKKVNPESLIFPKYIRENHEKLIGLIKY